MKQVKSALLKRVLFLAVFNILVLLSFIPKGYSSDPFGTDLGAFNGVTAYSNCSTACVSCNDYCSLLNDVDGTYTGIKWQCTEYVIRYYYEIYGLDLASKNGGYANTFFDSASIMGLEGYSNGGTIAPQVGDILVSEGGSHGHAAIVRSVTGNQVCTSQQNWYNTASDLNVCLDLTISNGTYTVSSFNASYPVTGWLRNPANGGTSTTTMFMNNTTTIPSNTTNPQCPADYPIDCGNGYCCPSSYPVCGTGANVGKCSTDGGGGTTTTSVSTTTIPLAGVTADFYGSPTSGLAPLDVYFTSLSNGKIASYEWDFGDGSQLSNEINQTHTYTKQGSYSIRLTVTGFDGSLDTQVKENYIIVGNIPITTSIPITTTIPLAGVTADFYGSPTSGLAPLDVYFTSLSNGKIASYEWDFGDRSTKSNEKNPSHTYTKTGSYAVRLTVTGNDVSSSIKVKENYIIVGNVTDCPIKKFVDNPTYLNTLYKLRDKQFTNFYGKLVTSNYYYSAAEITSILLTHPELQDKLRNLVTDNIAIAEELNINGNAYLPKKNADNIIEFLKDIEKAGGFRLKFYTTFIIKGIEYRFLTNGIGISVE